MSTEKENTLTINDNEYKIDELTDHQKILLSQVLDLDKKIAAAKFNLYQISVAKDSFYNLLTTSLESKEE